MSKRIDLTISILCIIEIICCFTPFCLVREYWKYKKSYSYHGRSMLEQRKGINIWGNEALLGKPLAALFICAAIIVAIICFIKVVDHTIKIVDKAWIFALFHTAVMSLFLTYSCVISKVVRISYRYEYSINWMSYIIIALNLIVLILSVVLKVDKEANVPVKKHIIAEEQKESADDLRGYKELLDSGVITQEEFDFKKKQIMGL